MTTALTCAVCGEKVHLDTDHVRVDVEEFRIDYVNDVEDYVLHERCADTVFGGWNSP